MTTTETALKAIAERNGEDLVAYRRLTADSERFAVVVKTSDLYGGVHRTAIYDVADDFAYGYRPAATNAGGGIRYGLTIGELATALEGRQAQELVR